MMTPQEKSDWLTAYHDRKQAGRLSANLAEPLRSSIKKECIKLYQKGIRPEGAVILKEFFKKNAPKDFLEALDDIDIDRFRPTVDLLNGKNFKPEEKHYELIAWLLGPEDNHGSGSVDAGQQQVSTTIKKKSGTQKNPPLLKRPGLKWAMVVLFPLLGFGVWKLVQIASSGCMYWNGRAYVAVSCMIPAPGRTVYAFDQRKIDHFMKIMQPDTVTKASVGKLWYFKYNHQLELFTDSGMHPVWSNRRLKLLTEYTLTKYLAKDTDVKRAILGISKLQGK